METNTQNRPLLGVLSAHPEGVHNDCSPVTMEAQPLPVAATLRKLEIGEEAVFPIEQRSSILTTLSRFRTDYARQGWDAEATTNKLNFTVVVKRVS